MLGGNSGGGSSGGGGGGASMPTSNGSLAPTANGIKEGYSNDSSYRFDLLLAYCGMVCRTEVRPTDAGLIT